MFKGFDDESFKDDVSPIFGIFQIKHIVVMTKILKIACYNFIGWKVTRVQIYWSLFYYL